MTAREYLQGLISLDRRINALIDRRDRYYWLAMRTTSVASGRSGHNEHSRTEEYALKLISVEQELDTQVDKLVDESRRADQMIGQLTDPRHQEILTYRYRNGWSWAKIARVMNYERSYAWRLHGEALEAFRKVYEEGNL